MAAARPGGGAGTPEAPSPDRLRSPGHTPRGHVPPGGGPVAGAPPTEAAPPVPAIRLEDRRQRTSSPKNSPAPVRRHHLAFFRATTQPQNSTTLRRGEPGARPSTSLRARWLKRSRSQLQPPFLAAMTAGPRVLRRHSIDTKKRVGPAKPHPLLVRPSTDCLVSRLGIVGRAVLAIRGSSPGRCARRALRDQTSGAGFTFGLRPRLARCSERMLKLSRTGLAKPKCARATAARFRKPLLASLFC